MSASDILSELPRLNETQRRRALEIKAAIEALQAELQDLIGKPNSPTPEINLRERGITEHHAAELRARLKSFAEDWDRPEASIYDGLFPRRFCSGNKTGENLSVMFNSKDECSRNNRGTPEIE